MMSSSDNKSNKYQYIYIAGHGHSGSTLLEMTLGNHPDIFAMGEIEKLSLQFARDDTSKYPGLCSCGKRPFHCNVWKNVIDDISNHYKINIKNNPFLFRVSDVGLEEDYGYKAITHWLIRNYYRLTRYICYSNFPLLQNASFLSLNNEHKWTEHRFFVANSLINITKTKAVVDSSKDYIGMRDLYQKNKDIMKIIFLTRDPRANAWSYVKEGLDPIESTKRWVTVNFRIKKFLEKIPRNNWFYLRYEDFCTDPAKTSQQLCNFLKYDYSPEMISFSKQLHTIGGNKIRYTHISTIKQDVSWKQSLPIEAASKINKLFGKEISLLGYNISKDL